MSGGPLLASASRFGVFMDLKDFYYTLPESLIATYPSRQRQESRLLVLKRVTGEITHSVFSEVKNFLDPGDLLVLNDTKVFPARLNGTKESGGKAEVLLLERFPHRRSFWIALIDAAKKPRVGSEIHFGESVSAHIMGDMGRGRFGLEFHHPGDFNAHLEHLGEPPLPPYVRRQRKTAMFDRERYQTVYAAHPGAIAAPTAGFHFTPELFEELQAKGIEKTLLTLHVGPGTFQPVRERHVENHRMEGERYVLTSEAAEKINCAKQARHRVVAVGSTSTRTLEWVALQKGRVEADEGIARLYLHPGESFRVIDALITNFHLPGSTPLILVAAFAGSELVRRAYAEAIEWQYRFYSYGDAMLIL
jgi:S-adenosylmethionine:tRNA ribosyltransferase-isomerase